MYSQPLFLGVLKSSMDANVVILDKRGHARTAYLTKTLVFIESRIPSEPGWRRYIQLEVAMD